MNVKLRSDFMLNYERPFVIAGPCSAESEDQVVKIAKHLDKLEYVKIFRAGIWKPRTRPNTFEGVGERGLKWLENVKKITSLLTCTEVATPRHVELALKHKVDIFWIGARTTANPFAVQEIITSLQGHDIPIMIKNPISPDLNLWRGAIERFLRSGHEKIMGIHRGFSSYHKSKYRNYPQWRIPIELKRIFPKIPIIIDPSHIAGKSAFVPEISQHGIDLGFKGLMIEVHNDPPKALSDAEQQLGLDQFEKLLLNLEFKKRFDKKNSFDYELLYFREKIDKIDLSILKSLQERMDIVHKLGHLKKENSIPALHIERYNDLLQDRIEKASSLGLSGQLIQDIFDVIHEESVQIQLENMRSS